MSVNVHILPVPGWPGLVRSVRTGALGVLVAGVLLMPFSAPAWIGSGALAASTAGEPAALTQEPIWADDSGLLAYSYPGISVGDDLDGEAVRALAAQVRRDEADERLSTLERLLSTPRPPRDPVALAGRLAGQTFPWTSTHPFVGPLEVGRRDTFYVLDQTDNTYKERPAILRVVSEYAYWYVQEGESVRDDDLATAARTFDQQTVPTVRRVFGTEWQPGIDGDNRVTIFLGSAPGPGRTSPPGTSTRARRTDSRTSAR